MLISIFGTRAMNNKESLAPNLNVDVLISIFGTLEIIHRICAMVWGKFIILVHKNFLCMLWEMCGIQYITDAKNRESLKCEFNIYI